MKFGSKMTTAFYTIFKIHLHQVGAFVFYATAPFSYKDTEVTETVWSQNELWKNSNDYVKNPTRATASLSGLTHRLTWRRDGSECGRGQPMRRGCTGEIHTASQASSEVLSFSSSYYDLFHSRRRLWPSSQATGCIYNPSQK